jgi:hypothetical protein
LLPDTSAIVRLAASVPKKIETEDTIFFFRLLVIQSNRMLVFSELFISRDALMLCNNSDLKNKVCDMLKGVSFQCYRKEEKHIQLDELQ